MAMQASDYTASPQDLEATTLQKQLRLDVASLGLRGGTIITDIAAHTPATGFAAWCAIQAVTDIKISALAGSNIVGAFDPTVTIPAGTIIYGFFTGVTLSVGTAFAYNL